MILLYLLCLYRNSARKGRQGLSTTKEGRTLLTNVVRINNKFVSTEWHQLSKSLVTSQNILYLLKFICLFAYRNSDLSSRNLLLIEINRLNQINFLKTSKNE